MNQKTIITLAVIAGVGVVGYVVWKQYQNKQALQVTAANNPQPKKSDTEVIANAAVNAMDRLAGIFGA